MKQLFIETSAVLGNGQVLSEWDCRNKYLAVVGSNYRVRIYNRSGNVVTEFALISKNRVIYLDWDSHGETLAVSQENQSIIVLYDISIKKQTKLNTDLKKITWLSWNCAMGDAGNILSVGSSKGNLLLYNKETFRKQLIMGKHSKKVLYGSWNKSNKLALVGKDKKLSISDISGNTINENHLKQYPLDLQFGLQMSDDNRDHNSNEEDTITMNMNGKTIYMYFINNPSQPIELAFQQKYGDIICYKWYGDGYILAGFSKGFVVSISTHEKEMGEEIHSLRIDFKSIVAICISPNKNQNYAAVSTSRCIKIIDLNTWKDNDHLSFDFSVDYGIPKILNWTSDGQILCVNTNTGNLLSYLIHTNNSMNVQVYKDTNIAYLSSLQQISIMNDYLQENSKDNMKNINVTIEPKLIAVGLDHICVTFNNHCWCYTFDNLLLFEYDFISEIHDITLNDTHIAALIDHKIFLINISHSTKHSIEPFVFNPRNEDISCFALTPLFLICASKRGVLYQMYLGNYKSVNEMKHNPTDNHATNDNKTNENIIESVHPNHNGTVTVFIDCFNNAYLYAPVTDTKIKIDKFASTIKHILWDQKHKNILYGYDNHKNVIYTFVYNVQTLRGSTVEYIDITTLNKELRAILIINGIVIGYSSDHMNKIEYKILSCYEALYESTISNSNNNKKISELLCMTQFSQTRKCFYQLMSLQFLQYAYFISLRLNQRELWIALSKKCLELLNIDLAISVFRSLQNASSVLLLDKLKNEDDLFLVSGHCCTLLNDFEMAQKLFLLSREPIWALRMRRNLLQFDKALVLSERIAPHLLPKICFEHSQQLEFQQKYKDALQMYERAKRENEKLMKNDSISSIQQCLSGIVRCTLRIGHIQNGVQLAMSTKNKHLQYECANLLQSMKQYNESGQLFIHCNEITKAAHCFIICKNFEALRPLINKVSTPSLHVKYAKEMELIEKYDDALHSYTIANDKLSVIRLYLYHLNEVDKAIHLVRANPFIEGAKIIATFTLNKRDIITSIEFLVLSKNFKKAFDLAKSYNHMDIYGEFLDKNNELNQFKHIAEFYISRQDHANAAKCCLKASLFEEALINFIKAGMEQYLEHILNIIRERNDDETIINIILDHISNLDDQAEIDKSTLFRLYLAIGDIDLATKMCVDISAQKQRMGKYQNAHQILFEMIQELMQRGIAITNKELSSNLLLLHSYLLVKVLIKKNDNHLAAKMLLRVCESISKFPSHTVQLLTSTVIQCQKTGLHQHALEYANYLMRAEYRKQIIPKYKKKIESIVRHSYKKKHKVEQNNEDQKEEQQELSQCPFCKINIPSTTLYCKSCKNNIPYCIVTGKHMVFNNWTYCPSCSFPALYTDFVHHIEQGFDCSMCHQTINADQITLHSDPVI